MSPQQKHLKNKELLEKTDKIFDNLSKLEQQVSAQEQVPSLDQAGQEAINEKEKAEQDYIKRVDDENPEQSPYVIKNSKNKGQTAQAQAKTKAREEIEEILSEDLGKIYQALPEEKRVEFKARGEKVAHIAETMILTFKFQARKILILIREWLAFIPGVNKYFLEQESKIKTQEMMIYAKKYKRENKKSRW